MLLARWQRAHGGELTRISVEHPGADRPLHGLEAGPPRRAVERVKEIRVTVHFIGAGPGAADLLTVRAVG